VKKRHFTLILSLFWIICIAQDFSREGSSTQMSNLSDQEKVKFINKNFYKLYSADFAHATELARWAVETAAKNKWRDDEANSNLSWGVITYLSGKYDDVLPKYFRARDLYDSLGNKAGLANINNELAVFYHKQKDLDKALACLDVSEKSAREVNDLTALGTSLGHRGSFLAIRGRFTEAKPYYEEVYKIRVQTKDSIGLGYALNDLAEIATNESNLQQALTYIDQSTAIREKLGDAQGVAINYINKGENYFKFKDYKNAARWMEKCLERSLAIGFTDLSRHTYDYLAKTYKAMGDYQKAFDWQERAIIFKDSLFNADRTRVIQEMQSKYETEKKEQQISLLNSENELKQATIERNYFLIGGLLALVLLVSLGFYLWRYRDQQKQKAVLHEQKMRLREAQVTAVIESQEKERRRFASDLHDGMGQLISALQLNINAIQQQKEPEKRDVLFENSEQILTDIHSEIRNIAFNLMPPVLIKEGLLPGLQELIRRINKAGSLKVLLSQHDMPARFNEVGEISLYRIIQELLSNIVKHAQASRVTVDFTGFDDEIVLTLEDDGMGYDLEKFQNHEGNGWRNISSRLNLIKGAIDFDVVASRKNNTVIITVPLDMIKVDRTNQSVNA
jgi:two-component system, NarL family, sensor kinase